LEVVQQQECGSKKICVLVFGANCPQIQAWLPNWMLNPDLVGVTGKIEIWSSGGRGCTTKIFHYGILKLFFEIYLGW
jgi:hypothetical protein